MDIRIIDDLCIIDEYPMTVERINGYISDLGVDEYSISRYRPLRRVSEKIARDRTKKIIERWIDLITLDKTLGWKQRQNWSIFRKYYGIGERRMTPGAIVAKMHIRGEDDLDSRIRSRLKFLRKDKFEKWHKMILVSLYLPDSQYEEFIDALLGSMDDVEAAMRRIEKLRQVYDFYNDILVIMK